MDAPEREVEMRKVRRFTLAVVVVALGAWLAMGATASSASIRVHNRILENQTTHRYHFTPKTLTIQKGDSIVWNNKSDTTHTVTFRKFNKTVQPGAHVGRTFTRAGTFKDHCSIHTYMHGIVVVK